VKNTQAIGRVYRPGQTAVAQLIYIRADGTTDNRVLDKQVTTKGWFKQIFGEPDQEDEDEEVDNQETDATE